MFTTTTNAMRRPFSILSDISISTVQVSLLSWSVPHYMPLRTIMFTFPFQNAYPCSLKLFHILNVMIIISRMKKSTVIHWTVMYHCRFRSLEKPTDIKSTFDTQFVHCTSKYFRSYHRKNRRKFLD